VRANGIHAGVLVLAILACLYTKQVKAHDVITTKLTYTRDISRIFIRHCSSCHGAGTSIPLTTYEEVRPWAVSIKEQVLSRTMPPWGAVKGFGDLFPDHGLSQEDILIISAWVVGGAPEGDRRLLPKKAMAEAPKLPLLQDALTVETNTRIATQLRVFGIRPLADATVSSAKVVAHFPDGRIQPLLWLYRFNPKYGQTFRFRRPLDMQKGTVVESSAPLRFALEAEERGKSSGK
jgi:hypothetical protein